MAKMRSGSFIAKQVVMFAGIALAILVIDVVLYVGIALFEVQASNSSDGGPNPEERMDMHEVSQALVQDGQGTWTFTDQDLLDEMAERGCWACLVDEAGQVVWSYHPDLDEFPTSFSRNEIAVISHDRAWGSYFTTIWTKDPNLIIMGYPDNQFIFYGITLSQGAFLRLPLYFLFVFLVDLLLIFLLYAFSQRSLLKSTGPMLDALDNLAQGKPAQVSFTGLLRVVGNRINAVSDTLMHKETARKNWIAGVSHDVRTPLAIVMGHAEQLEQDASLPEKAHESAVIINRQGTRIRDLIEDLNIATQLEYDMQPLKIDSLVLAKTLRSVVADYLNQGVYDFASFDLEIAEDATHATIRGDERLIKRALRNAIDNALKHNSAQCNLTLSLDQTETDVALAVRDDGRGMSQEQLFALASMLERDYLGAGSISQRTDHSVTFSHAPGVMGEERNPDAPELPQMTTAAEYAVQTPIVISSQKMTPQGQPLVPPNKRPPAPPTGLDDQMRMQLFEQQIPQANMGKPQIAHGGSIGKHGLGLPLIARIVLVHKGTLTLDSVEGKGFAIIMTFPRAL